MRVVEFNQAAGSDPHGHPMRENPTKRIRCPARAKFSGRISFLARARSSKWIDLKAVERALSAPKPRTEPQAHRCRVTRADFPHEVSEV